MADAGRQKSSSAPGWFARHVVGLGLGGVCAVYGVIALLMGRTFLPGLRKDTLLIGNRSGLALAASYLLGGMFLILRFYPRAGAAPARSTPWLYWAQNLLLTGLLGALVYVLVRVGTLE